MNNKINILYTCDNAYLPLTSISMASVIANNPESLITFYVATEDKNSDNFKKLQDFYKDNKKIEIVYHDAKKYDDLLTKKGLDRWGSNSYYVYWKLFAYDELKVDRIWYLDSDVICLRQIDNPPLEKAVGACLDSAHACFNKYAHIPENYYFFNTGSLYVDVKKWKKENCTKKIYSYIENMKYMPLMCDQDILALALQEDIEVLPPEYDYLVGYDYYGVQNSFKMYSLNKKPFYSEQEVEKGRDKTVFYHCLGGVFGRPWEEDNESPIRSEFEKYRALACWSDFHKERNMSVLFRIEKMLEILPKSIYNQIHNLAMRKYVEKMAKK